MSGQVFDWDSCRDVGSEGELRLARYLESLGFVVKPYGQKNGAWPDGIEKEFDAPDLLIEGHKSGTPTALASKTVEVKADSKGHETGNTVLELFSNMGTGRRGWAYECPADFLAFIYLGNGKVILVAKEKLQEGLREWQRGKVIPQQNQHFTSLSLLVPTKHLEAIALHVGVAP